MKRKVGLYAHISICVIFVIAIALFAILGKRENGYLYFSSPSITTQCGQSMSIADLGLKHSMNIDKVTISCDDGIEYDGELFVFTKAGNRNIIATSGNYKAKLEVIINIDSSNILTLKANGNIIINNSDTITIYHPDGDRTAAITDGYINSLELEIEFIDTPCDYNYTFVGDSLTINNNIITTTKVGKSKIYLNTDVYGVCMYFFVNVKDIAVQDIQAKDIYKVNLNTTFTLDCNVVPSYATDRTLTYEIIGDGICKNGEAFNALSYGTYYIKVISVSGIEKMITIIITDVPDRLVVEEVSPFIKGFLGSVNIKTYLNDALIDADIDIYCLLNNERKDLSFCLTNYDFKHSVFSGIVNIDDSFEIVISVKDNSSLNYIISVNN